MASSVRQAPTWVSGGPQDTGNQKQSCGPFGVMEGLTKAMCHLPSQPWGGAQCPGGEMLGSGLSVLGSLSDSGLSCRDFCSQKEPTHLKARKKLVRDSLLSLKDTKNSTRACWSHRGSREEASPLNHPRRVQQQSVNIPTGSIFSGGQGRPCPKRTEKPDFKDRQNHLKMHQNPIAP